MDELADYDYQLPRELIAQHPLAQRPDARLLIADRTQGEVDHYHVRDLVELLRPDDCLVFNDTRVIPARMVGRRKATGGRWEGLFLEASEDRSWRILGKTRGKLQAGESIVLQNRQMQDDIELVLIEKREGGVWVVMPHDESPWLDILSRVGRVPLPHYIRGGEMMEQDVEQYQTVFAERPGSVAAPTAGLHFSELLLEKIKAKGVGVCFVTLHVSLDTFRPVTAERLEDHQMHSEWGEVTPDVVETINERRARGGRVIAVGTTSVRVLESASRDGQLVAWQGNTDLFIRPPYQFKSVDVLMTNFHLPKTTLLVLVRTFGGDALIQQAYREAVDQKYRFFSYGDAMLIV